MQFYIGKFRHMCQCTYYD